MGGINKHPSTNKTWEATTRVSLALSHGLAELMLSNAALEEVILAEHGGGMGDANDVRQIQARLVGSTTQLRTAKQHLLTALDLAIEHPSPHIPSFQQIDPASLSEQWNETLMPGQGEVVERVAAEIKRENTAPMKRFVNEIDMLIRKSERLHEIMTEVTHLAMNGQLKQALEDNSVQFQARFARLLASWTQFMQEFIADSLVATHVAFADRGKPALAA